MYPQPRADDLGSVTSDQTMQRVDSQSDYASIAKAEVEEALRSFALATQQQRDQVVKSLQVDTPALPSSLEQAAKSLPTAVLTLSQRLTNSHDALHGQFTQTQSDLTLGFRSLEEALISMSKTLQQETTEMQSKLVNIETRIKRKKRVQHKKRPIMKSYPPGALGPVRLPQPEWCDCILQAGKRMTRIERIRGMQEGRLVCKCKK